MGLFRVIQESNQAQVFSFIRFLGAEQILSCHIPKFLRLARRTPLVLLEPVRGELERAAVLCDDSHHVVRGAGGHSLYNLKLREAEL